MRTDKPLFSKVLSVWGEFLLYTTIDYTCIILITWSFEHFCYYMTAW